MDVGNSAPDVPSDFSPNNAAVGQGAEGYPISVNLSWIGSDPNEDSLLYDIYFGDDLIAVEDFNLSARIVSASTNSSHLVDTLDYGKTYHWRIVATDPAGLIASSDVHNFTTKSANTPTINHIVPSRINTTTPSFSWHEISGITNYQLQIDDNNNFVTPNYDLTIDNTSTVLTSALGEGQWYWRLASIADSGVNSSFSEVGEFYIDLTAPDIPTSLQVPTETTMNTQPQITWTPVEDAVRYRLQLSQSNTFVSVETDVSITEIEFVPEEHLETGDWNVRISAVDEAGNESAFSAVSNFEIDNIAPGIVGQVNVERTGNDFQLTWDSSAVNETDFFNWTIYRSETAFSDVSGLTPFHELDLFSTIQYTDTAVAVDTDYYYAVSVQDALGNENQEAESQGPNKIPGLNIVVGQPYNSIEFASGQTIEVTWTDDTLTGTSTVSLYYDDDNLDFDGEPITAGIDATAPVVTAPSDISVEATDVLTTLNLGVATANDDIDGSLTPVADNTDPFGLGNHTVTWSATDVAGNVGTAVQAITVEDTTVPVISVPADVSQTVNTNDPIAINIGRATGTDIFDVTITNNAPATYSVGITTVTWTATDTNGNTSEGDQVVTVTDIGSPAEENLALYGPTAQSSTYVAAIPSLAVDGNTNGVYSHGSVAITLRNNQSWWQVDLGSDALISQINIWNRTDTASNRLKNYYVLVSTEPMYSTETLDDLLGRTDVYALV